MSNKCSIPSSDGQFRNNELHLNVFWGVQMDIERFNYVDIVFRKYHMGILRPEIKAKEDDTKVIK